MTLTDAKCWAKTLRMMSNCRTARTEKLLGNVRIAVKVYDDAYKMRSEYGDLMRKVTAIAKSSGGEIREENDYRFPGRTLLVIDYGQETDLDGSCEPSEK